MPQILSALNYFNHILIPYILTFEHVGLAFSVTVCVVALLECFPVIGYLMPGMVMLYGAAAFALRQDLVPSYIIFMAIGSFLADIMSYYMGKRGDVMMMKHVEKRKEVVEKIHGFLRKYGAAGIIIGKNIGVIRPMISLIVGTSDMSLRKFLMTSWIASVIWPFQYLISVYYIKKYGGPIGVFVQRFWIVLLVIVLAYCVIIWLKKRMLHKK